MAWFWESWDVFHNSLEQFICTTGQFSSVMQGQLWKKQYTCTLILCPLKESPETCIVNLFVSPSLWHWGTFSAFRYSAVRPKMRFLRDCHCTKRWESLPLLFVNDSCPESLPAESFFDLSFSFWPIAVTSGKNNFELVTLSVSFEVYIWPHWLEGHCLIHSSWHQLAQSPFMEALWALRNSKVNSDSF